MFTGFCTGMQTCRKQSPATCSSLLPTPLSSLIGCLMQVSGPSGSLALHRAVLDVAVGGDLRPRGPEQPRDSCRLALSTLGLWLANLTSSPPSSSPLISTSLPSPSHGSLSSMEMIYFTGCVPMAKHPCKRRELVEEEGEQPLSIVVLFGLTGWHLSLRPPPLSTCPYLYFLILSVYGW